MNTLIYIILLMSILQLASTTVCQTYLFIHFSFLLLSRASTVYPNCFKGAKGAQIPATAPVHRAFIRLMSAIGHFKVSIATDPGSSMVLSQSEGLIAIFPLMVRKIASQFFQYLFYFQIPSLDSLSHIFKSLAQCSSWSICSTDVAPVHTNTSCALHMSYADVLCSANIIAGTKLALVFLVLFQMLSAKFGNFSFPTWVDNAVTRVIYDLH